MCRAIDCKGMMMVCTTASEPYLNRTLEKNFKLTLEYDGTLFSGWQVQTDQMTVQGELQKALSLILNQPIHVMGSGRTDAGVHAMGQVAHLKANTRMSPEDLQKGVNSLIKHPVVVTQCEAVDGSFHARYSARSKEYHYHILNRALPCAVGKNYLWHIRKPLDIDAMNQCGQVLVGEHDFKSFEGAGSPRASTVRTLYHLSVRKLEREGSEGGSGENGKISLIIKGNGFLRFMVRNIMGTLVMAGHHKITPKGLIKILQGKDRGLAGATAPPQGLFLMKVNYE